MLCKLTHKQGGRNKYYEKQEILRNQTLCSSWECPGTGCLLTCGSGL